MSSKTLCVSILYLVVSLVTLRDVLLKPGTIGYNHDWAIAPFPSAVLQQLDLFKSGWTFFGLGGEIYFVGYWGHIPELVLASLGFGGDVISKSYVVVLMTASGLTFFFLLKTIGLRLGPSAVGGLIYMFTPLVFNRLAAGHIYHLFSYAWLPLLISFFVEYLKARGWRRVALFCGTALTFGVMLAQLQFAILASIVLLTYGTAHAASRRSAKRLLHNTISTGLIVLLGLSLYSPWLLSKFVYLAETLSLGASSFSSEDWLLNQLEKGNFLRAFTLRFGLLVYFEEGLTDGWKSFMATPLSAPAVGAKLLGLATFAWIGVALLVFLIAISAIFVMKDRRLGFHVQVWSFLTLVGMFLASGANPPNLSLWSWVYLRAPYLLAYLGELENLVYIPTVGLTLLFAVTLNELGMAKCGGPKFNRKVLTFTLLVALLVAGYALPSIVNYKNWLVPFSLDDSYRKVYDSFAKDPSDFRTLWIPPIGEYGSSLKGRSAKPFTLGGTDPLFSFPPKPSFSQFNGGGVFTGWSPYRDGLRAYMLFIATSLYANRTQYLADILEFSAVKYLLLRMDAYSFVLGKFLGKLDQSEVAMKKLQLQKKIVEDKDLGTIKIYQDPAASTALYTVPKESAILLGGDFTDIASLSYFYNEVRGGETHRLHTFLSQLSPTGTVEAMKRFGTIALDPSSVGDLNFSLLDERFRIYPGSYANRTDPSDYVQPDRRPNWWGTPVWPIEWTMVAQPYLVAYTVTEGAALEIPVKVPHDDEYLLMVKLLTGPESRGVEFWIDGINIGNASTLGSTEYFKWHQLEPFQLSTGAHKLSLRSLSSREAVTLMTLAPVSAYHSVNWTIGGMRSISILELERAEKSVGYKVSVIGERASSGEVLEAVSKDAKAYYRVLLPKAGNYTAWFRLADAAVMNVEVWNDAEKISSRVESNATGGFGWASLSIPVRSAGWHYLRIGSDPGAKLDLAIIEESRGPRDRSWIEMEYRRYIPTIYVRLDSAGPFFLVDSESFNNYWKADGPVDNTFPANGFAKAYYVNRAVNQDLTLYYAKQRIFESGWVVAAVIYVTLAITLIVCTVMIGRERRRQ